MFNCLEKNTESDFAGVRVRQRHDIVSRAIGFFEEEEHAYNLVTRVMWAMPLAVSASAVFDAGVVIVYMKFIHPWRKLIVADAEFHDRDTKL